MGRSKREDRYARLLAEAWRLEGIDPYVEATPATGKHVAAFKSAIDYYDQLCAMYTPATTVEKPARSAGRRQGAGQRPSSCAVVHSNTSEGNVADYSQWWSHAEESWDQGPLPGGGVQSPIATRKDVLPREGIQHYQHMSSGRVPFPKATHEKMCNRRVPSPIATGKIVSLKERSYSRNGAQQIRSELRGAGKLLERNHCVPCTECGQWGHSMVTCPEMWGPPQPPPCFECGQQGHDFATCPGLWGTTGGTGGQETKPTSRSPVAQVYEVAPSNAGENCLEPTGGAKEKETASAEIQRTQRKSTMVPESGGKTVVNALLAGTAYSSVTETDSNPVCGVGVTPVGRPAEPLVRGLPLQNVCQSGDACVKNACCNAMLPCKVNVDEGKIDVDACYMWCNSGDKTALSATKGAAAEVSLETPMRINRLEPEASRDEGSTALLGTVETATCHGKQLKLVQNVEHTSECNAHGELAPYDIDVKGVIAEPRAQGADCPIMSLSMFKGAKLNDIAAQCTREKVQLGDVVPPAHSTENMVNMKDVYEEGNTSLVVATEGLMGEKMSVHPPDASVHPSETKPMSQGAFEGRTDSIDWSDLTKRILSMLKGVSGCTIRTDPVSVISDQGAASHIVDESACAAAAVSPQEAPERCHGQNTTEMVYRSPDTNNIDVFKNIKQKREVNATNRKADCKITEDAESCSTPLNIVCKDIDNGEDVEGQRSEQLSAERMFCEVATGDGCSMVAESSASTALPIADDLCKRVKIGDIECGDSDVQCDTLPNGNNNGDDNCDGDDCHWSEQLSVELGKVAVGDNCPTLSMSTDTALPNHVNMPELVKHWDINGFEMMEMWKPKADTTANNDCVHDEKDVSVDPVLDSGGMHTLTAAPESVAANQLGHESACTVAAGILSETQGDVTPDYGGVVARSNDGNPGVECIASDAAGEVAEQDCRGPTDMTSIQTEGRERDCQKMDTQERTASEGDSEVTCTQLSLTGFRETDGVKGKTARQPKETDGVTVALDYRDMGSENRHSDESAETGTPVTAMDLTESVIDDGLGEYPGAKDRETQVGHIEVVNEGTCIDYLESAAKDAHADAKVQYEMASLTTKGEEAETASEIDNICTQANVTGGMKTGTDDVETDRRETDSDTLETTERGGHTWASDEVGAVSGTGVTPCTADNCRSWKYRHKKDLLCRCGSCGLCVRSSGSEQGGGICGSARQCHWLKAYFKACPAVIQGLLIAQVRSAGILDLLRRVQYSRWEGELRVPPEESGCVMKSSAARELAGAV